tara:strand:- start:103 stop:705 length:603 start_codon:yes stop_codon:yes gene_type:complete
MKTIYNILKDIPEKNLGNKDTTSLLWKRDVIDFFHGKGLTNCLEIGTCAGVTTKILSHLFEEVYTIEFNNGRLEKARQFCKDRSNIKYFWADAYSGETYKDFPKHFDVVVIDCMHLYPNVIADINRALTFFDSDKGIYLVFDDYGHPESIGVKQAVDEAINIGLKLEKKIGEDPGFTVHRDETSKFTIIHKEGIILSYGI